jgi:hypothetical protein
VPRIRHFNARRLLDTSSNAHQPDLTAKHFVSDRIGEKQIGFRFWHDVCNEPIEMKARGQLDDLSQGLSLDNITRNRFSIGIVKRYIHAQSMIHLATAIRIRWQEE